MKFWTKFAVSTGVGAMLMLTPLCHGDVLVLTDGTELVGKVTRITDGKRNGYEITDADEVVTFVPATRVRRIVVGRDTTTQPADAPSPSQTRLDSLRRSVANIEDLAQIVQKYEVFLEQLEQTDPIARTVRDELAQWRDRLDRGMVRLGDEWVTGEEREQTLASAFGRVNEARLTLQSGNTAEAMALATALIDDPTTKAGGHYLLGVLAFNRNDIAVARQQFEAVRELEPRHAPTLNNLATIQTQLGRAERAMWFLAEAMEVAPVQADVLDNAAEALQLLDGRAADDRNSQRVRALFDEQDLQLQAQRRDAGLFRWGGQWLNKEQFDQLDVIRKEVEAEVAKLKEQYDDHALEIRQIERQIESNLTFMRQLEQQTLRRDAEGNIIRFPLPESWYSTQRDNQNLERQRGQLMQDMEQLDQAAAVVRQKLPSMTYAGKLTLIGEDGVPVMLPPAAPARLPDTRPAEGE